MKKIFNLILSAAIAISSVNPIAVCAEMTELNGTWQAQTGAADEYISFEDNAVKLSVLNRGDDGKGSGKVKWKADNRSEIDYVLDKEITSGNVTVSYEFKTNEPLQAAARAAEIRFTDSENNSSEYALSVVNSVSQPYIYQGPTNLKKFTEDSLNADEWHEVQYVFYIDENGVETKQVIIDSQDTNGVFSYKKSARVTSLKAVEFWFFGNSADTGDYELNIRNMKVSNGLEEIEITSDTENGETNITKNSFELYFSHAVTADSVNAVSLLDENDTAVSAEKYGTELLQDGKSAVVRIKTDEADSGKTYKIKVSAQDLKGQKSEILSSDYILSFTFGTIEPTPNIVISSDIEDNASDFIPVNMRFALNSDKEEHTLLLDLSSFDSDMIKLLDENGTELDTVKIKTDIDTENNALYITVSGYEPGKKYAMKIAGGVIEGLSGEKVINDYILHFTASSKTNVSGAWKKTYSKHESSFDVSGGNINIKVKNDGTNGSQNTRDAYTYTFDNAITGTNVPVKVKFKFKANEALSQSESELRFYPYSSGENGGTCICSYFPYSKPQFRWDGIKFNLPDGISTLAPNEWHDAEYLFLVDSVNGFSMLNAKIDGANTDMTYTKASTKQMGCVDFWFYSTAQNTDDLELSISDFSVISGTDIIKVESDVKDGAVDVEPKDMKLVFSEPLYYDCDIKEAISIVDSQNNVISSEKYSVTMTDNNTAAYVTMNTDDRDSEKTYKIFVDKSKVRGKYYSVIAEDLYISFTLPKINPKATLGIEAELPQGAENITPSNLKFNFIPLPNDRISDVSEYVISADKNTDLNSVIKIYNADGSAAGDVISSAVMNGDYKGFAVSLSNYDRYTGYVIKIAKGSIVGNDGEIMQNDFAFAFTTAEIDKPPYTEYKTTPQIAWKGNISYTEENGITTYNYKNSTAKGDSNARTEICYNLDEAIKNSEGPVEISYSFQINEALANTKGNSMQNILTDSGRGGFMFCNNMASAGQITDYTHYVRFYKNGAVKSGEDSWNTVKYILDVDNGVVKNGYAQLNDNKPVNITSIENSRNNFGAIEFRLYSMPNDNGEYEDYVLRLKDLSVKSLGALKGTVTTDDNKNLSLRFSYNIPFLFESDIKIAELKNGKYEEIKQSYHVEDMDAADMKQVNITIDSGGLAYNKNYRVSVNRKGITADSYVKLKVTDIDFKTKEYPDNLKADLDFISSDEISSKVNCSITNLQAKTEDIYIIVAAYSAGGEMVNKYCKNIDLIDEGGVYKINDITLSGSIKNIKVFIFKDDVSFKIYHMPQSFEK